jgi:hypothetical protein
MINREIKVGDKIRWLTASNSAKLSGDDVYEVNAVDRNAAMIWDNRGRSLGNVFCKPENYEHIDEPQADPVNHPPHYTNGEIECIDAIRAALGREGFIAYCRGNALKYLWRCDHKGGTEDLKKARWYQDRAIKEASE